VIRTIDETGCAHFMADVITATYRYPLWAILNFDESNWHLVMADDQTVAIAWRRLSVIIGMVIPRGISRFSQKSLRMDPNCL
jgi:hypothetical protein